MSAARAREPRGDGTHLGVELGEQEAELLEHLAWRELGKVDEEAGEDARALVVLRAEALARDLAEDLVAELGVVELARERAEALGHVLGQVLIVLEGLHDRDLGGEAVPLVLDGVADCAKDAATDLDGSHVLLAFEDVVYRTDDAAVVQSVRACGASIYNPA